MTGPLNFFILLVYKPPLSVLISEGRSSPAGGRSRVRLIWIEKGADDHDPIQDTQ